MKNYQMVGQMVEMIVTANERGSHYREQDAAIGDVEVILRCVRRIVAAIVGVCWQRESCGRRMGWLGWLFPMATR